MNTETEINRIEDALEVLEVRGRNSPGGLCSPEEADDYRRLIVRHFDLKTAQALREAGHPRVADALLGCGPEDTAAAIRTAFESLLADLGQLTPEQAAREFAAALNATRNPEEMA